MVDTQDIDALLIGALYGELTPADEARLSAHLESHPADRSALDDLTRARAAVRDSQIFAVQLDPPQAVSALLLQEAARRAPKRVARPDGSTEREGWFARFVRSFAAHPGVAAAAMLVVVIGVASTLYLKKGDPYVEQTAPEQKHTDTDRPAFAAAPDPSATTASATAAPTVGSPTGSAQQPTPLAADDLAKDGHAGYGSSTAYDVELTRKQLASDQREHEELRQRDTLKGAVAAGPTGGKDSAPAPAYFKSDKAEAQGGPAAKPQRALEVNRREPPMPKELADSDGVADAPSKADPGGAAILEEAKIAEKAGASQKAAQPSTPPSPVIAYQPSAHHASAPATAPAPNNAPAATVPASPPPPPPAKVADKTVAKSAPGSGGAGAAPDAPRDDASATSKDKKKPDDASSGGDAKKTQDDSQAPAWAKSAHDRAKTLAQAGKCQDVGTLVADIAQRAPDYYNKYVATDRALKQCNAYIAAEREKNAEKASKSRAKSPAPAPSAADEQMK